MEIFSRKVIFPPGPPHWGMPASTPSDKRLTDDEDEAAIEEWKAETTTFDRVRQIVDDTTEPCPASEIAERSHVSEPTARKYLESLVDAGRVRRISTDAGRRYMRSPTSIAMRHIASLHRAHTRSEIRGVIEELETKRQRFREIHDVEDGDELATTLDADADGWNDVEKWWQIEEDLDIAQAALILYDFDPDESDGAARRVADSDVEERGALGNYIPNFI